MKRTKWKAKLKRAEIVLVRKCATKKDAQTVEGIALAEEVLANIMRFRTTDSIII